PADVRSLLSYRTDTNRKPWLRKLPPLGSGARRRALALAARSRGGTEAHRDRRALQKPQSARLADHAAPARAWPAFSSISVARRPCGQSGTVRRCTPAGAQSRRRSALEDPQTSGGG